MGSGIIFHHLINTNIAILGKMLFGPVCFTLKLLCHDLATTPHLLDSTADIGGSKRMKLVNLFSVSISCETICFRIRKAVWANAHQPLGAGPDLSSQKWKQRFHCDLLSCQTSRNALWVQVTKKICTIQNTAELNPRLYFLVMNTPAVCHICHDFCHKLFSSFCNEICLSCNKNMLMISALNLMKNQPTGAECRLYLCTSVPVGWLRRSVGVSRTWQKVVPSRNCELGWRLRSAEPSRRLHTGGQVHWLDSSAD